MPNPIEGFVGWYQGLPQAAQIGIPVAGAAGVFLIVRAKGGAGSLVSGPFGSSTGGGAGLPGPPIGNPPPQPPPSGGGGGGGIGGGGGGAPGTTGGASGTSPKSTPTSGVRTISRTAPVSYSAPAAGPTAQPTTFLPGTRYKVPARVAALANQYNSALQSNPYAASHPFSQEAKTIQHQRQADVIGVYREQAFLSQFGNEYATTHPASLEAKIIEHQRQGDVFAFPYLLPSSHPVAQAAERSRASVVAHISEADVKTAEAQKSFLSKYSAYAAAHPASQVAKTIEHQRQGDVAVPAMTARTQQGISHPYIDPRQLANRAATARHHAIQSDVAGATAPISARRRAIASGYLELRRKSTAPVPASRYRSVAL